MRPIKRAICARTSRSCARILVATGSSSPRSTRNGDDTLCAGFPPKISYAHLDGDLYDSILVSLRYTYSRLSSGAVYMVTTTATLSSTRPGGAIFLESSGLAMNSSRTSRRRFLLFTLDTSLTDSFPGLRGRLLETFRPWSDDPDRNGQASHRRPQAWPYSVRMWEASCTPERRLTLAVVGRRAHP